MTTPFCPGMAEVLQLLAHLGLKVVDADAHCVSAENYQFLTASHARVIQRAPHLIWDDE